MHRSTPARRGQPRRRTGGGALGRTMLSVIAVTSLVLAGAPSASAFWSAAGVVGSAATTAILAPPTDVTVPATAVGTVPIEWTASTGIPSPDGYVVTRTDETDGALGGTACSTDSPATSCTDTVGPGSYSYVVTAVYRTWTRESDRSSIVTVTVDDTARRGTVSSPPAVAIDGGPVASKEPIVEVSPSPVPLGSAVSYSVLALTGVVNTGATALSGDLGVAAGASITGFPPGTLGGSIHEGDVVAETARADLEAAIDDGFARTAQSEIVGDLGGRTLTAGVHQSTAALALNGALTLDAQGDPDAVFILRSDAALTTGAASAVVLAGGAQAANVFWIITGDVATAADSALSGSILARGGISLGEATALSGRALSLGTVTLELGTLTGVSPAPTPTAAPTPTPVSTPTASPAP